MFRWEKRYKVTAWKMQHAWWWCWFFLTPSWWWEPNVSQRSAVFLFCLSWAGMKEQIAFLPFPCYIIRRRTERQRAGGGRAGIETGGREMDGRGGGDGCKRWSARSEKHRIPDYTSEMFQKQLRAASQRPWRSVIQRPRPPAGASSDVRIRQRVGDKLGLNHVQAGGRGGVGRTGDSKQSSWGLQG